LQYDDWRKVDYANLTPIITNRKYYRYLLEFHIVPRCIPWNYIDIFPIIRRYSGKSNKFNNKKRGGLTNGNQTLIGVYQMTRNKLIAKFDLVSLAETGKINLNYYI